MQPPTPWSDADVYTFRTLWGRGASTKEIAAVLKRSPAAVQLKRRHLGLPGRPERPGGPGRPVTVWTEERLAILRRDWPARVPIDLIAMAVNRLPGRVVTAKMVAWTANHRGLKRGPRPPSLNKARTSPPRAFVFTPEREAIFRATYPTPISLGEILRQLNGLPGPPVEEFHCWRRAKCLGLRRRSLHAAALDQPSAPPSTRPPESPPAPPLAEVPPVLVDLNPGLSPLAGGEAPEFPPLPDIDAPPTAPVAARRVALTRDGSLSIASLMAAAGPAPGAAEPIAWADALRWAQHNKVPLDGPPAEILRRINAVRAPMPPWRIVRARRPDDPLPPPWFGTNGDSHGKPTKGTP